MPVTHSVTSPDADWQQFSTIPQMDNHWNKPDWRPGVEAYYWYLTFNDHAGVREMAERCQASFRGHPAFDVVALNSLHMTLDRIGFAHDLTDHQLDQVSEVAESAAAEISPFTARLGPLAGSTGALSFSAAPFHLINELRLAMRGATRSVLPTTPDPGRFRPHVGIAYCNATIPTREVIQAVRQLRSIQVTEAEVRTVAMVRLTRRERAYEWEPRAAFKLGR